MKRLTPGDRLLRAWLRPPYRDEHGAKGWLTRYSHAPRYAVRKLDLAIAGWPAASRPLRIAFLSDFHLGSHAGDIARLEAIVADAATFDPDLVLHGGDFVNMQPVGGGRIPPSTIARVLAQLDALLGRFAVLGNHDYTYGANDVAAALETQGIRVLDDARVTLRHEGLEFDLIGLPDARELRPAGRALLAALDRSTLALAHDPFWFAHLPAGPHLMLAGHTHGGQVRLPLVGALRNASAAPIRWTYGLVEEGGRRMYVTSGLGSSGVPLRIGCPPEFAIIDVAA